MKLLKNIRGATIVEYMILLFFLVGVSAGTMLVFGGQLSETLDTAGVEIGSTLSTAQSQHPEPTPGVGPGTVVFDDSSLTIDGSGNAILLQGTVGTPYSLNMSTYIDVTDADPSDVVWTADLATLPDGLSLSSGSGVFSGNPSLAGNYPFDLSVALPNGASDTQAFIMDVYDPVTLSFDTSTATMNDGSIVLPDATQGDLYSEDITIYADVTGVDLADLVWSFTGGALPTDMNLASAGSVGGTPSVLETATFTATMTAPSGVNQSQDFEVTVVESVVLAFDTSTATMDGGSVVLTNGAETVPYTGDISVYADVSGVDPGDLVWSVAAGSLPAGITLDNAGALSGTPTTAGSSTFTGMMTAPGGEFATQDFSLTIDPAPVVLAFDTSTATMNGSSVVLDSGTEGVVYTGDVSVYADVSGVDPGDLVWSVAAGSLPTGITMDAAGALSGTPTVSGPSTFTGMMTAPGGEFATQDFEIFINPEPVVLAFDTSTATMNGGTVVLTDGTQSSPYSEDITVYADVSGVAVGDLTWSVTSGSLPSGVSLTSGGLVTGTSEVYGTYTFEATMTAPGGETEAQSFEVSFDAAPGTLSFSTSGASMAGSNIIMDPRPRQGEVYSYEFSDYLTVQDADMSDVTWTITSGTIPNGLTLNAATGELSGTATNRPASGLRVVATLPNGESDDQGFLIQVDAPYPSVSWNTTGSTVSLPSIRRFSDVSSVDLTPYMNLGSVPMSSMEFSINNSWEHTLASNSTFEDGILTYAGSAKNSNLGTWNLELRMRESGGTWTDIQTFEVDVVSNPTLVWRQSGVNDPTVINLPQGYVGQPYTTNVKSFGNLSGADWDDITISATPAGTNNADLPDGMTISSDGTISGTPEGTESNWTTVNSSLTDSEYTSFFMGGQSFYIPRVWPNFAISSTHGTDGSRPLIPNPEVGVAYSFDLKTIISLSPGNLSTYTLSSTNLPDGLSMDANGVISGTPTTSGRVYSSVNFGYAASSTSRVFNVIVDAP